MLAKQFDEEIKVFEKIMKKSKYAKSLRYFIHAIVQTKI